MSHKGHRRAWRNLIAVSALTPIVLQKLKFAGRRIFHENKKQETIANSYDLNRVTEVTCECKVEATRSLTSLHESRACGPQIF